jgi:hypothetical protein
MASSRYGLQAAWLAAGTADVARNEHHLLPARRATERANNLGV